MQIPDEQEEGKRRCEICKAFLRKGNKEKKCESHNWPKGKRSNDIPSYNNSTEMSR